MEGRLISKIASKASSKVIISPSSLIISQHVEMVSDSNEVDLHKPMQNNQRID